MDQYDIHKPVVSVVTGVEFPVVAELITLPPSLSLVLWIPVVSREELVGEANRSKQRLISPPPSSKPTSPSSPQTNTHDINALPQCAALRSFIYLFLNACATFLYGFNCFYTFVPVSRTCLHTCTDTRDVIKPSMSRRGSCRRGHVQKACDLSCGLSELWYQCVFTGWWLCLLKPAEEWHDRDFPSRATKAQCECAACMLTYTILFHCQTCETGKPQILLPPSWTQSLLSVPCPLWSPCSCSLQSSRHFLLNSLVFHLLHLCLFNLSGILNKILKS